MQTEPEQWAVELRNNAEAAEEAAWSAAYGQYRNSDAAVKAGDAAFALTIQRAFEERTGQLIPAPSVDDMALAMCKADGYCTCEVSCHKPGDIFHTYATLATTAISAMQVKP